MPLIDFDFNDFIFIVIYSDVTDQKLNKYISH
jgi:hypothetical protein